MTQTKILSLESKQRLLEVSTATLTAQLLGRGFRNTFMPAVSPLRPDLRMVGTALTLRYAPAREDVSIGRSIDNSTNVQRLAVESIDPGQVLVIDARGDLSAGSFGQILATRIKVRGAAGLVSDGALRDTPAFQELDLAVYARAAHAAASAVAHWPVDMNVPIGCAGVLVIPGDVVVGDAEGVVIIPADLVDEVARDAHEQEQLEAFIQQRVEQGSSIRSVYPPDAETLAEYNRLRDRPSHGV
jgi:regulator of RNase E activity RraA